MNEAKRRCTEAYRLDHERIFKPDLNTPFSSADDAIERLLPYHIIDYPDVDDSAEVEKEKDEMEKKSLELLQKYQGLTGKFQRLVKKEAAVRFSSLR